MDNQSHRTMQREILGIPAPARGGGFEIMTILHHFNIHDIKKNIFRNSKQIEDDDIAPSAIKILKEYLSAESESSEFFNDQENSINKNKRSTEREGVIKVRVFQDALRERVLANYNNTCALCEIDKSDLLICSHIIPWSADEENRLNQSNAISLCVLHDKLFDKGYFTLNEKFEVIVSKKANGFIRESLSKLTFKLPKKYSPNIECLKFHAEVVCKFN